MITAGVLKTRSPAVDGIKHHSCRVWSSVRHGATKRSLGRFGRPLYPRAGLCHAPGAVVQCLAWERKDLSTLAAIEEINASKHEEGNADAGAASTWIPQDDPGVGDALNRYGRNSSGQWKLCW